MDSLTPTPCEEMAKNGERLPFTFSLQDPIVPYLTLSE